MKKVNKKSRVTRACLKPVSDSIQQIFSTPLSLSKTAKSLLLVSCIGTNHSALALNVTQLDGANGFKITGAEAGERLGRKITAIGDINGDDISDFLVAGKLTSYYYDTNYVVFSDPDNAFPAQIDIEQLDGSNGFVVEGNFNDHLDINGDGINDLLFDSFFGGSTYISGGFVVIGRDTALDGPFSPSINTDELDGSDGFKISGSVYDISTQGDISGDGIDDIVSIDVTRDIIINGNDYNKFSVNVIFGKKSSNSNSFPADLKLSELDGKNGLRIDEAYLLYDGFSFNSYSAAISNEKIDFNGDGVNDLFTYSDYDVEGGGGSRTGHFHSLSSLTDNHTFPALLPNLDGLPATSTDGFSDYYDSGGVKIGFAGDINDDGFNDVFIRSRSYSETISRVVFNHADGYKTGNGNSFSVRNHFVVPLGDVNDDGIEDLFFLDSNQYGDEKNQFVVFGQNTANQGQFPETIDKNYFNGVNGFNLTADVGVLTTGDFNDDGINDVIVSLYSPGVTPKDDPNVYVLFGTNSPVAATRSLADLDSSSSFKIEGETKFNSVAVADMNADGVDDIVLGSSIENDNTGAVYVVFGTPGELNQPLLACAGDVDGNGSEDMAVLIKDQSAGTLNALVKDINGNEVSTVGFNGDYNPAAFKVMADTNNNRSPELVVIDKNTARAEVRDSLTGELLNELGLHAQGGALDIEPLIDQSGNAVQELVSLSAKGKVNVKDALSSQTLSHLSFSTSQFNPEDLSLIKSLPPKVAVLFENIDALKRDKVTVKDMSTGRVLTNLWYGKGWDLLQLELLADQNGNGSAEAAVLRQQDNRVNVTIRDSQTGRLLNTQGHSKEYRPIKLALSRDLNGNGSEETVLLGAQTSPARITAVVKDSMTNQTLNTVYFNKKLTPLDLAVCEDMNGNNKPEIVVLGERNINGELQLIIKDANNGQLVGKVDY